MTGRLPRVSPGLAGALSLLLAVSLAGCLDANTPTPGPTGTAVPEETPQVTVYVLGATVWYEGLIVHVDRATATLDARGGPVEVTIRIENPNDDVGELDGPITLVIGTTRVAPNDDSDVPLIPPTGSMPVTLTYDLQAISSIDLASIEIGSAPEHVGRVPLTAKAGESASLEPVTLAPTGTATSVDLKITLRTGELRWDLPDWSQELDNDLAALTLAYDATYTGTFSGGFAFTAGNVALRLPNGTVVNPRRDGHSQSAELIGAKKTKKGLFSRFEIPSGMTGAFALLVRNGSTTRTIKFTIGG